MKFPFLIKDPITLKRIARFRAHRRALWSLRILIGIYLVSLGSELICNDKPLWMHFEGAHYFPAFTFYPESAFLPDGRHTRPDYKALQHQPVFTNAPENRMLFPPVPFGPTENIDPESIAPEPRVTLRLAPIPRVASIDVHPDLRIRRTRALQHFLHAEAEAPPGTSLTALWSIPEPVLAAIKSRFRNEAADAVTVDRLEPTGARDTVTLSLSPFRPRTRKPSSVRLTVRQPLSPAARDTDMRFRPDGSIEGGAAPLWTSLSETRREGLMPLVFEAFKSPVYPPPLDLPTGLYEVSISRNDVTWPHAPVKGHLLGIDSHGRDVLARILYGLRISMTFGFLLVAFSMVIGTCIGAVQGYFGGILDITVQRLIEIWSSLPFLYIIILLGSIYGPGFGLLLFCYGLFNWIGISYYMRGEFLRLRKQPFVDAARTMGLGSTRIIGLHILPNALTPLITFLPFQLVGAIGALAALDYLGFGLPPPTASWGELLQQAQQFRWAWWLILYPSAALFAVMLLCVFIGEGVRDAFDPRKYARMQ